jgi:hypothetical protein
MGSALRNFFENLTFSPCLRKKSELLDECNKVDFDRLDDTIWFIVASFACRPLAIT